MSLQTPSNANQSPFLPQQIFLPQEEEESKIRLNNHLNFVSLCMNQREISNYELTEIQNGERWFSSGTNPIDQPKRSGFRQVYQFGAVPAGTLLQINHNIKSFTFFTHIYGTFQDSTNPPINFPLPWVVPANDVTFQTSLSVTSTQILVNNGANGPDIVSGIVVLEYLRT